jgi:hypothetical protein
MERCFLFMDKKSQYCEEASSSQQEILMKVVES